jgi:hypothetical protein
VKERQGGQYDCGTGRELVPGFGEVGGVLGGWKGWGRGWLTMSPGIKKKMTMECLFAECAIIPTPDPLPAAAEC